MEFDFTSLAFGGEQHIVAWDAKRIAALKPDDLRNLTQLLDVFGKKSAVAQGLGSPVTDIYRLRSTDQRLYLYMYRQSSKTVVLGGLKVGTKRLYVRTITAELREIEPVCVLDFYVHESCQRQGVGKALFEYFLHAEGCDPACIAYDRPSPKLIGFLRKHYGLQDYVPQSNNFVVFNRYFELNPAQAGGSRGGSGQGRLNSRGSTGSGGTPSIHPLGPRSTPPPQSVPPPMGAPAPIHKAWIAPGGLSVPSSAVGPPPPLGNSPSFGRRWAASTFAQVQPPQPQPYPASLPGQDDGPEDMLPGGGTGGSSGGGAGYSSSAEAGYYQTGDSLDAFSRSQYGGMPPLPPQPHNQPGRLTAPWDAPAPSGSGLQGAGGGPGLPPASRGTYSSRPPWAVDDGPGVGVSGQGTPGGGAAGLQGPYGGAAVRTSERLGTGSSAAVRGPLQTILSGGSGREGGGGGPHTRALQQQLAVMQHVDGAGGQGQSGEWPGPPGSRQGSGEGSGPGAAKIMAVAQRSGAGAADCLVW